MAMGAKVKSLYTLRPPTHPFCYFFFSQSSSFPFLIADAQAPEDTELINLGMSVNSLRLVIKKIGTQKCTLCK